MEKILTRWNEMSKMKHTHMNDEKYNEMAEDREQTHEHPNPFVLYNPNSTKTKWV